jgi:hypothetical protein
MSSRLSKSNYVSDEYLEDETREREYKAFTFNLKGLRLEAEDAVNLCVSNEFDELNPKVISNLREYFKYYSGKYLSGFFNAKISGKLFIGIDDWGILKGIPFKGDLPTDMLTAKFYQYLKSSIQNKQFSGNLEDFVKVKFIKIDYSDEKVKMHVKQHNPEYIKYLEKKAEYDKIMSIHREEFENWKVRYAFAQQKLIHLLNNSETRLLIIDCIKNYVPPTSDNISDLLANKLLVIKLLESGEKIPLLDGTETSDFFADSSNPYFWASEWKENKCKELLLEKPKAPKILFPEINTPYNLINSVSNMIPYWMSNNSDMNLYLVQIDFNYDDEIMGKLGKWYYKNNLKKWVSCKRIIKSDGEPANLNE